MMSRGASDASLSGTCHPALAFDTETVAVDIRHVDAPVGSLVEHPQSEELTHDCVPITAEPIVPGTLGEARELLLHHVLVEQHREAAQLLEPHHDLVLLAEFL